MIQELLGGVHVEERKISIPGGLIADGSSSFPSTSCTSISSPSQSSATSSPSSTSENHQNLRCPRCDSSNTKFCYYNNYNLTQPRHFCKTCRRYWTKGGALRNVPIGGGCRKTKAATPSIAASGGKSGGNKAKPMVVDAMGRPSLGGGLEHDLLPSSPILWANMPQSSQLLALLRASQIQNASPNPTSSLLNSIRIKEEGAMIGSHMATEANGALNVHSLSLDTLGQLPIGPCSSSLWRNEGQYQYQQQQQQQQQQNMLLGEVPTSSGIQELYQRLRSSVNYGNDHLQVITNNVGSPFTCSPAAATTTMATTTTTTSILDPVPLSVGEFGYWNPVLSWSDLPTTNGAFP